ncbi:conserved unknown protein [Ectocarpus siliculosus]|uniref:B box-type domain-containing protein n=1 Tax=Ectocarpus siliculosus TaxID=2880 RepID=D8LT38_ECTSI|nr:conserved unknown protein [Ectocarpus siliculosus]|eukprot:CBN75312.1 conserved unknown protein [Ectocarpus siliculosus]
MQTRRWVIGLQALTRGWLGRRRAQFRRTYTQHLGEERAAGRVRWKQLIRRREDEELLNGARSEDLDDDLELHRTFMKYCRFGDRRNTGRMVVAKLTALCKDAGIIDKRFPVQRVEISFSRLKPRDLSHLPYPSFLAALDDIGTQHPDLRRLGDAAAAAAQEESVAVLVRAIPGATTAVSSLVEADRGSGVGKKSKRPYNRSARGEATSPTNADGKRSRAENSRTPTTENRAEKAAKLSGRPGAAGAKSPAGGGATAKVAGAKAAGEGATAETAEVECLGGFRPDDQRLLVLLQKFVFVNSQAGKEACSEMEAEGRGARRRALDRLEAAAMVVQACVARGCSGRALAREASGRRELHRHDARLNWAASLLQTRMRAFAARTRAAKLAMKRYYRCLDGLTGAEYYFDPKTGKSSWTKPKILGKFDISTAVVVPAGEEIMVPMCHECAEEVATEICADCDEDMLCHLCVDRIHRTGNASTHLRVPIEMCEECSFQVAVKHCQQCGDNFCVSCFAHIHRKGRIRRHTFEPLVGMCHDCGDRAQAFQCFGCDTEGCLLLCKRCLEARHHYLLPDQLAEHRIEAVGFRSLKLKRLKEEQSSRARELWMKAESAATGKRSRDKKMLAAAIKIQAVWRGYLARKRRRHLMDQHLLWKIQRHKDDQIRKKLTYKVARYFGKARLLKSDTNQEIVLKQYPRWWQSTIMDIVRPTFGWHEGAKMVREQEFFAKKTKRKGRWKVHAARLRLGGELIRLRMESRKQRKYERLRDKAVGVYQHARAKGGVSAAHKEELQQISRKAKRAVQNHQQEREKAEERVKAAENALEALIGPFRLRNNVRAAVTEGMLMPFPVSMQKGKANARLEKGQNMREVLKWMPYGRRVRVEPTDPSSVYLLPEAEAGACPRPPSHAFGPFYVVGVKESRQNDKKDKAAAAASALAGNLASKEPGDTKERPATGLGSGAAATTPAESIGEGGTAAGADGGEDSVVDLKAQSSPVLILDRQWLLEEAPLCQAYAMPILPVIQKILMVLRTGIRDSSVVQVAIKVAVVGTHQHRDRLERWQTKFDDDSDMHARLERWAAGSEDRSKRLMLRRRKLFDVEEGFQPEKRRVMEAVESVLALWTSLQEMTDFAKSAAATGLASTQGADGKGMIGGKLGREVVVQLFKKWVQSDDRTKVIIMHRSGKAANEPAVEVVQVVGYIKVDLDTPTPVLREFIRRYCGGWLNEHAKGDHFVMEDTTGEIVRRNREGGKLNATAMDMVQERINKTTRDTESVIFVRDERSRTDPDAEVELVLIPEKDFLDPESTPTFEDGVNAHEEGNDNGDGDVDAKGARKKHREEDGADGGDESDAGGRSSDFSSDQFSASIGSMGSDLEEDEDDPFAAMQKDLQDEKDAHNSATNNDTAGTNEAARG